MRRKRRQRVGVLEMADDIMAAADNRRAEVPDDSATATTDISNPRTTLPLLELADVEAQPIRILAYDDDLFSPHATERASMASSATGSQSGQRTTSPRTASEQFDIYFYRSGDASAADLGNRNLERRGDQQIITRYHNLEIITAEGVALKDQTVVLIESLGEGTFADCYKAEYNGLTVAVKILKAYLHPAKQREAFYRELHALRKTADSDLTLDLIGYRPPPHYWIITSFMNQGTLHSRIKAANGRPLNLHEVLDIGTQISSAMSYLHSRKIMHRDLTPFNLLFHNGSLRLCDFGVSVDVSDLPNATIPTAPYADESSLITQQYDVGYLTSSQIVSSIPSLAEACGNDDMYIEETDDRNDSNLVEMEEAQEANYELDLSLSPNGHPYYRAPGTNCASPFGISVSD